MLQSLTTALITHKATDYQWTGRYVNSNSVYNSFLGKIQNNAHILRFHAVSLSYVY